MTPHEKRHIQNAFSFELGKVKLVPIRQRVVNMLLEVSVELATIVGNHLGLTPQKLPQPITGSIPADGNLEEFYSFSNKLPIDKSPAVSQADKLPTNIKARRIALLTADGVNDSAFTEIKKQLCDMDAIVNIIALKHGFVTTKSGDLYPVCESLLTASSVVFDAVYVAGGDSVATLSSNADALHFVAEAFKHCKPIGADADAAELLIKAIPQVELPTAGVVTDGNLDDFVIALQKHRFWEREEEPKVPA